MSKQFYPGDIRATTVVNEPTADFNKHMNEVIHDFEGRGFYVELSYGGKSDGRHYVMIIGREKIYLVDKEEPVPTNRFARIKEATEDKDEVSR